MSPVRSTVTVSCELDDFRCGTRTGCRTASSAARQRRRRAGRSHGPGATPPARNPRPSRSPGTAGPPRRTTRRAISRQWPGPGRSEVSVAWSTVPVDVAVRVDRGGRRPGARRGPWIRAFCGSACRGRPGIGPLSAIFGQKWPTKSVRSPTALPFRGLAAPQCYHSRSPTSVRASRRPQPANRLPPGENRS